MRFVVEVPAAAGPDVVRARLAPDAWPTWWPGAVPRAAGRVDLELAAPRPLKVGLQVIPRPDGAEVTLVEGELAVCHVVVTVVERVRAEIELVFPIAVPATLRHDLEAWLRERVVALASISPPGSSPA